MMLFMLYIATLVLVLLCIYILFKTRNLYEQGRPLSTGVSVGWLVVDALDILIIAVSYTHQTLPTKS